ncbi:MAG: CDP-alcohol phosphatidyltransferase family protein [Dehalococcoidia bacterium]|nr:CDP-alcohol phosphatidyltransferase family protein [Dehalococcoidia bacterium]
MERVIIQKLRRSLGDGLVKVPARVLGKAGISPDMLTAAGLVLAVGVAWVLSEGRFFLGGFLVLLSGAFDLLDGAVARATGRSSRAGALLDSIFDRFGEAAVFMGLLAFYGNQGAFHELMLVGAVLIGSMMTSYVKARAEGLGLKCDVGLFTRPERVILLAIGLIINQMLIVLWIMAVLTNFVAWQRLWHVYRRTGHDGGGNAAPGG